MEMIRPPFPEVVDSSMIAALRSCLQKAYLEFFEHWKLPEPSVHLRAGAAYAEGLEVARRAYYENGEPEADCVAKGVAACLASYGDFPCPDDSPKSASRTAGAVEYHFDRYPLRSDKSVPLKLPDGKRAIEFNGAEPIDYMHPVTGQPLLYSWRMDMGVERDGMPMGHDDKTTQQLGASWPRQWDLRSQFTSYCWGSARNGVPLQGFIIRGVSILKTKYDTLEAITYRPRWMIDLWYVQMLKDIHRIRLAWEAGYYDYNLDHACAEYGGCMFKQVCSTPDTAKQNLLNQLYQRRRWDPITRTETLLVSDRDIAKADVENDVPF